MSISSGESAAPRHPLPDHLARYPTPLHVFHEEKALTDATELEKGLKSGLPGAELFYSVKTNPLLPLLRSLLARGWGMEAVGDENLRAALAAGTPGDRILYAGAAWTKHGLEQALFGHGIRHFTVDSLPMAELLSRALLSGNTKAHVAFRLHDGASHFGFHTPPLRQALALLPADRIASFGLHIHCNPHGSARTVTEIADDFRERCRKVKHALSALESLGPKITFLDLGGGIDSPYVYRPHPHELGTFHNPGETENFRAAFSAPRFLLREAGALIARTVTEELGPTWAHRRILFEPGRSVCTRALDTVVEVRAVKKDFYPDAQVAITDGDTAFLGPLHRGIHAVSPTGTKRSFVYGRLPHAADWLFQAVRLPELHEGQRLLISHTGAYFLPLAARFGHERPRVVRADRDEEVSY